MNDGDGGRHLEVDLARSRVALGHELERHRHPGLARVEQEQRDHRPAPGGERAEGDQRVHGRRAVPQVGPGGAVERPAAPEHDRRGELEREPLPVVELERRDHRQHDHGHRQEHAGDEPHAQRRRGVVLRRPSARRAGGAGQRGPVARVLDGVDQGRGLDARGIEVDGRALGRVVDGRRDALEAVEPALDAVGARGARHALDRQLERSGLLTPRPRV